MNEHNREVTRKRVARWRANNLEKARQQGRDKSKRYAERHPQMVRLSQQVQRLKRKLREYDVERARQPRLPGFDCENAVP